MTDGTSRRQYCRDEEEENPPPPPPPLVLPSAVQRICPPRPTLPFWNYTVEFKRERSETFIGPAGLPLYSFVFVEADRGYDLGCVIGAFLKGQQATKRILENATRAQILALDQKVRKLV